MYFTVRLLLLQTGVISYEWGKDPTEMLPTKACDTSLNLSHNGYFGNEENKYLYAIYAY
jgi:hypothetical protein